MRFVVLLCLTLYLVALPACLAIPKSPNGQEGSFDWRSDWAIEDGYTISIDTEGYHFPSAIAFVPNPGQEPKDPLYFVTEIRGKVKVVTNDRTVYTFAEDFFELTPEEELPSGQGEVGLAGICLDPEHGYVFVTFAYADKDNILRNNIVRFQSKPQAFSLEPISQESFTDVFLPYYSGLTHQIGPCQVKDETLFVSVGEGNQPVTARQLDAMNGKIIRMNLDGKPLSDNPFYQDEDIEKATNYVWAYGFRNPFGLTIVDERLFVADNGRDIDRFLEVLEGQDYLWNGTDRSIATNADYVFAPSLAPVQIDYYSQEISGFPTEYLGNFFVAVAGVSRDVARRKTPGIMTIEYGLEENRILTVPKYFVRYRNNRAQMVTGLAFGPDGLYFTPLHPNEEGRSPVLKIATDADDQYPFTLVQNDDPLSLMDEKGCFGCHTLGGYGDVFGGTAGPPLEREDLVARLDARLTTEAYVQSLKEVDSLDAEPQRSYKEARRQVMAANDRDRVRLWMTYRLQEPRFDNLYSRMPNPGLSEEEISTISNFLLADEAFRAQDSVISRVRQVLPTPRYRYVILAFVVGFALAAFVLIIPRAIMRVVGSSR